MKEDDYRLTALAGPYGKDTRSYNRGPEKKEMDRQRKRITEEYKPPDSATIPAPLSCGCIHRSWAHADHNGPPATLEAARWQHVIKATGGDRLGARKR